MQPVTTTFISRSMPFAAISASSASRTALQPEETQAAPPHTSTCARTRSIRIPPSLRLMDVALCYEYFLRTSGTRSGFIRA